tara:strand:- start:42 stop:362 length:321 start_codon:yes stop_codon:yes gene_type:complete
VILPKAKAKLAKFIVISVKNRILNDFIYLLISKRIDAFIKIINVEKTITLENNPMLLNNSPTREIKTNIGKIGCNPLKPELNLIRFNKSIPKTNLCRKNPNILLSL